MKKIYILLIITIGLAISCRNLELLDDLDSASVEYDAEFAIPVLSTEASIQDLLNNFDAASIEVDADGLVHVVYRGDYSQASSADLFAQFANFPLVLFDTIIAFPYNPQPSLELEYIILKSGKVVYGFESGFQEDIDVTWRIIGASKNGQPLEVDFTIEYPGNNVYIDSIDLTGYRLEPINDSLFIEYEAYNESGERVIIGSPFPGMTFNNFEYSYVQGKLGTYNNPIIRDTIEIDFFDDWQQGEVWFEDPVITVEVSNSVGVPAKAIFDVLDVFGLDGSVLPITGDVITNGVPFEYPSFMEVGETKTSVYVIDKTNSNVREVLNAQPVALDYDIDVLSNPDSLDNLTGFLTDSSAFSVAVEVDLPVHGWAKGFSGSQEFDFSFDEYENIESLQFKILTENGIPLQVGMQFYFLNRNAILDSLMVSDKILLEAAPVDGDGVATQKAEKVNFVTLSKERYEKVKSTDKIRMVAFFDTFNEGNTNIKVFDKDEVSVKVGLKVGIKEEF